MAVAQGYGKTVTSGSVFAYDVADTRNSYKGEPTVNLVPYSEYQHVADNYTEALGGWDTHEGTLLIDPVNKVPGYTNRSIKLTCVQANVYKYHFSVSLTNGQTYTVSFWGKATTAGQYGNFLLADGPGGYLVFEPGGYSNVTTEFKRFTYTFTVSSPTGTYNFATYLYGDGQTVWLTGFQLENKNHVTQYLPSNGGSTTRSATQGLLPLVGNSTLDLSNVSFDSNAQMTFDGTNDYIDLGYAPFSGTGAFTIETVYTLNTTDTHTIIGNYPASSLQFMGRYGLYINGSCYFPSSLGPGTYYAAATRDGSGTCKLYLNGVLVNTVTNSTNIGTNSFRMGTNTGGGEVLNGKIPVMKLYNRALSAGEVRQNYLHYKTRFNLS